MSRPFIVLGDQTDHGGVVIEASIMTDTHGKGIARVGDQVTCPKRNHGTTVIVTGDPTMIIDGKAAARHGDKCACGATLISSQFVSTVGEGGGGGSLTSVAPVRTASTSNASASVIAADDHFETVVDHTHDMHFLVKDEVTGSAVADMPYRLTLDDGTSVTGKTDGNGLTQKISSSSVQTARIEVPYYGDSTSTIDTDCGYDACHC
jgi:uncharacterized Zn-binding protein involved in type VI secretion